MNNREVQRTLRSFLMQGVTIFGFIETDSLSRGLPNRFWYSIVMPSQSLTIRLPKFEETFSVFPDNGLNPHYANSRAESQAWINKYHHAVCGPNMRTFMDKCNFELASALFYPYANEAGLRATMDLVNLPSCFIRSLTPLGYLGRPISFGCTMS